MSHSEIGFAVRHAGISKIRARFTGAETEAHVDGSLAGSPW
jgi:polyisoprenoid-binding protein YceI